MASWKQACLSGRPFSLEDNQPIYQRDSRQASKLHHIRISACDLGEGMLVLTFIDNKSRCTLPTLPYWIKVLVSTNLSDKLGYALFPKANTSPGVEGATSDIHRRDPCRSCDRDLTTFITAMRDNLPQKN
jgi:hypothetical protein